MRNIETFPSKHMYLYLSLVERKVAEFYQNMVEMTYFHRLFQTIDGVLGKILFNMVGWGSGWGEVNVLFSLNHCFLIPKFVLGGPR